jgi:hydroxymethylpyrimidine/phosphomethylpyrimidine kinase
MTADHSALTAASPEPAPATRKRYARVLIIAGSDSGGGAGIQADLKTCSALGCYGMTAITAITVQNTLGVSGIHGIPVDILRGQIDAVVEDIGADAVKIGMLATPEVVRVVADAIRRHQLRNVVLDPVMVATSGDRLIAPETASVLVRELFPLATVVTPNLDEAALLLGHAIDGVDALDGAVQELLALGAPVPCSRAGTCRAIWWWTCWAMATASGCACSRRASPRTTAMARAARCRRRLPRTWRWACRWRQPWPRRASTSWARLQPAPMCSRGPGMAP